MPRTKLLLLELNEVPYRVIDAYCEARPRSFMARLRPRTDQYQTITDDRLALDPWISWPTFHRGVTDETHHILHLGQVLDDVDGRYPPIWRLLKQHEHRVGVFGSLHSSSVPDDVREYDFYLPDYFDAGVFAHPQSLLPFQELNLAMTRQSARNVTRRMPLGGVLKFAATAPALGLKLSTVMDCAWHLASEVVDHSKRIRRRAYQPLVMADLFLKQLERAQPDFASFYTNHVAAAMHRYWGATFPQDYVKPLEPEWIAKYSSEIHFAMDKFDVILSKFASFVERHPEYSLMVASSMGQAAIPAEQTYEFLTVTDVGRFAGALGVPDGGFENRPAMVPCQCVVIRDDHRSKVLSALATMSIDGRAMVAAQRPVAPMSFDERQRGFFQFFVQFDNYRGSGLVSIDGRTMPFEAAGLGVMAHEDGVNCTAQHVPEGSLMVYRAGQRASRHRGVPSISTVNVAPSILNAFGLSRQSYMPGEACIRLD